MSQEEITKEDVLEKQPQQQNEEMQNDTLGLVGMIIGILGVLFSFCCTFLSILPGIAAIVCGVVAYNQGQRYGISAIVLGVIASVTGVVLAYIGIR